MCIQYANKRNLLKQPGWKWIPFYIESDSTLVEMIHTYHMYMMNGNTYRYDMQFPKLQAHALRLHEENGAYFLKYSIAKKINQILHEFFALCVLKDYEPLPTGYHHVSYHLAFDVKVVFCHKSCLVTNSNLSTTVIKEDIFTPNVSLESVCLGFLLAHICGLKYSPPDVGNAYLIIFTSEKLYIVAGIEFGPEYEGQHLIVDKSVYGTHTGSLFFHGLLSIKHFKPFLYIGIFGCRS